MTPEQDLVRQQLKVLLLHLASYSESPGEDLKNLLEEVIEELYIEVKDALRRKHLRLIRTSEQS